MTPEGLRYTKDHEWAKLDDGVVTVGITHYAQDQLGDVVFVELPKVGTRVRAHQTFGVVESVKAVSDLFAPVSGEIVEVNAGLAQKPETVNQEPYAGGWMLVVAPSDATEWDQLLTAAQYEQFIAEGGH